MCTIPLSNLVHSCASLTSESANHLQTVRLVCLLTGQWSVRPSSRPAVSWSLRGVSLINTTLTVALTRFHLHAVIFDFSSLNFGLIEPPYLPPPACVTHLHNRSGQPSEPKVFDSSEAITARLGFSGNAAIMQREDKTIPALIIQPPDCWVKPFRGEDTVSVCRGTSLSDW